MLFLSLIAWNRCIIRVLCLISLAISWDLRLIFRLTIIGDLWFVIYLAIVWDLWFLRSPIARDLMLIKG